MSETPFSVERIIRGNQKFRVPIYQRLFVWDHDQIYQLLTDLYNAQKSSNPYYIGVITVKTCEDGEWEVVDGQQRITFLTLLGCELGWKDFVFAKNSKEDLRIAYTGREHDQEDIKNCFMSSQFQNVGNQNFIAFHNAFEAFKNKYLNGIDNINQENVNQYSAYVMNHCQFLVNQLPENYGPFELNLYFEKMNSTGRQLTPVECIKGKYFSQYASVWNICMNFDTALPKTTIDDISDGENSDNYFTLGDFLKDQFCYENETETDSEKLYCDRLVLFPEVFLLHVLAITKDVIISFDRSKVIETFKCAEDFDHKLFIEKIIDYRRWLDENIIYLKNDNGTYHYCFRSDDAETTVESRNQLKIKQLQSMLYVSSPDSQEWVLTAYRKAKGGAISLDILTAIDKETHHPDLSSMKYPNIDRYWFWKLDYLLWEKIFDENPQEENICISFCDNVQYELSRAQTDAILHYRFMRNRSIEHLHPQNPSSERDDWAKDREYNDDRVRNAFGNLCMISQGTNSSLGNETIDVKFAKIKEALQGAPLQSVKLMLMFACCDGTHSEWTPERAIKHGKDMFYVLGFDRQLIDSWEDEQRKELHVL